MQNELEATFLAVDPDRVREALSRAGFSLQVPEYLMRRKTFDFSAIAPGRNRWGRVRQESDKVTMTVKEVQGTGINDTFEVELVVNSFVEATRFLEACNAPAKSFQENRREVWTRDNVEATIDTWPGLKPFVEIEGPNEAAIQNAANELGFSYSTAVFGSIDMIYELELGIKADVLSRLPEVTFDNPPRSLTLG